MSLIKDPGRFAGLLYVVASIPGFFGLAYVPSKLLVGGNATATANNIVAHEMLFRLGIAADLVGQAMFIFVALALYDLFKGVNQRQAALMVILIVVSIPIAFLNEVNSLTPSRSLPSSWCAALISYPYSTKLNGTLWPGYS